MKRGLFGKPVLTLLDHALRDHRFLQDAGGNLEAAVGLRFERIERVPGDAVGIDDLHLLLDFAVNDPGLAEHEAAVAIDRCVAVADHVHEAVWATIEALNYG